jgi:hypothetical protein
MGVTAGSKHNNDNDENKSNSGVKRRPDSIHDGEGVMHKVWQEPVDGIYQVFYARQGDKKEMGIGTDNNPSMQLTDSPYDSVRPRIAEDSASGIIYIIWTEHIPASDVDAEFDVPPVPSIYCTATLPSEDDENGPSFTDHINLADGSRDAGRFEVHESEFQITSVGQTMHSMSGFLDTDGDGILDHDEAQGNFGYLTSWRRADTDSDGLKDKTEIQYGLHPLKDDRLTVNAQLYYTVFALFYDADEDGLTNLDESRDDYPVTAGVANILSGGHATYRFYPMEDFNATLTLGVMSKRYSKFTIPPPENSTVNLLVTVDSDELGTYELSFSKTIMEWERVKIDIGSFNVSEDAETDIRINVSLHAPSKGMEIVKGDGGEQPVPPYWRSLEIWSLMISAPAPDYDTFSYKEGRDFIPEESDKVYEQVKNFEIKPDPNRKDLFVEVDALVGHDMVPELYSEAINAYSDAGIILHYKLDEQDIPHDSETDPDYDHDDAETLRKDTEVQNFLSDHRNSSLSEYVHLIFVSRVWSPTANSYIYGTAMSAETADDLDHAGIVIADKELMDADHVSSSLFEKRLKTFIHEIGHALNCAHDWAEADGGSYDARVDGADGDDDLNMYNVMMQNHFETWRTKYIMRGDANSNRDLGATLDIARPRFSIESVDQMNLQSKLSVETGRNKDLLVNYV